jgi:hypothetical protein
MDIKVEDFMTFLRKAKDNNFLRSAFREIVASQTEGNPTEHIETAIYNLEIALSKQRKEEFYSVIKNK